MLKLNHESNFYIVRVLCLLGLENLISFSFSFDLYMMKKEKKNSEIFFFFLEKNVSVVLKKNRKVLVVLRAIEASLSDRLFVHVKGQNKITPMQWLWPVNKSVYVLGK